MKIYLVQHGLAVDEKQDPQRPLSEEGVAVTKKTAAALAGLMDVKKIYHSGKLRSIQTADIFAAAVSGAGLKPEEINNIKPKDDISDFVAWAIKAEENFMVAGHLPHLSKAVSWLVAGKEEMNITAFKNSGVICLEKQADGRWLIAAIAAEA